MKQAKKGFTLIEVILVLAIAAMIFLMVLLTLPAVQRSQRDLSRRDAVGSVIAAYTEFLGNNRGTQPINAVNCEGADGGIVGAQADCQLNPYLRLQAGITFSITDGPSTGEWTPPFSSVGNAEARPNTDRITVFKRATCGVNGAVRAGTSNRQIAVVVALEGAGADGAQIFFCQDS